MVEQLPRKRLIVRRVVVAVAGIICLLVITMTLAPRIGTYVIAVHQRSTTKELAQWANEYGALDDDSEVGRAIDMLEYIPTYYLPQEGYHSDPSTEATLERQRAETIKVIVEGLRDFSGKDFGNDASKWRDWHAARNATTRSDMGTN